MNKQEEVNNRQAFLHWRNANQDIENILDDFMFYLKYDYLDILDDDLPEIQRMVDSFLGFDSKDKIKQFELSMLERWNQSVIDTESK